MYYPPLGRLARWVTMNLVESLIVLRMRACTSDNGSIKVKQRAVRNWTSRGTHSEFAATVGVSIIIQWVYATWCASQMLMQQTCIPLP